MFAMNLIFTEILNVLIRAITGKLFTNTQIHTITSNTAKKYLSLWFPTADEGIKSRYRVEEARHHILSANEIIRDMRLDLENQSNHLEQMLKEVEEKKHLAEQYATIIETNEEQLAAFRKEIEEAFRKELIAESERGKYFRMFASSIIWLITLVLGAAMVAYFSDIVSWVGSLFA